MKFKGLPIQQIPCKFYKAIILSVLNGQLNCGCVVMFFDVDVTGIILLSIYLKCFISPVLTTIMKDERLFSCICVAYCYRMLADLYL